MTSPSSPSAQMAISTATVPLHIATQCSTPSRAAILDSSSCTSVPLLPSHRRSQIPSAYRSRKSLRRLLGFGGYHLGASPVYELAGLVPLGAPSFLYRYELLG